MILSKSLLQSIAKTRNIKDNPTILYYENRVLLNQKLGCYDIFLSHSYLDKVLVMALVKLFNENGFSVYVDWMENEDFDRTNVNERTADVLRKRMKSSATLVYVSTENIVESKWCPWELGYFDGIKNSKCCILPILDYGKKYIGREYLGLYKYLEYGSYAMDNYGNAIADQTNTFYVCNNDRTEFILFQDWINNIDRYNRGLLI